MSKKRIIDFIASFDRESFVRREMNLSAAVFPIASSLPAGAAPVKVKSKLQLTVADDDESDVYRQDLVDFINDTESEAPMAPLTRAPRLVVTPPENIDTVGYLERILQPTSESYCTLRKKFDLGWKYPKLKMGEFRPPETHQQEHLTPWQQLSFDREVSERIANGLAPPSSPLRRKKSQSQMNSLSSEGTRSETFDSSNSPLDKYQFLEKRLERLEKGVEMSDKTPPTGEMHVSSRSLRAAGEASIRNASEASNRSPPKTRGKAIVHSLSTGSKFEISRARAHLTPSKPKSSSPLSFLDFWLVV